MPVQAEALAQEAAGAAAYNSIAHFLAGDNPQPGRRKFRARQDIGDEASADQALTAGSRAREFALVLQAQGPRKSQRAGGIAGHAWLNRRETFAAHAAAVAERGAPALAGIAVQEPVLALAPDFRRLILTFHVLVKGRPRFSRESKWDKIASRRQVSISQIRKIGFGMVLFGDIGKMRGFDAWWMFWGWIAKKVV